MRFAADKFNEATTQFLWADNMPDIQFNLVTFCVRQRQKSMKENCYRWNIIKFVGFFVFYLRLSAENLKMFGYRHFFFVFIGRLTTSCDFFYLEAMTWLEDLVIHIVRMPVQTLFWSLHAVLSCSLHARKLTIWHLLRVKERTYYVNGLLSYIYRQTNVLI